MLEALIIYSLVVYFLFHLASRADLLSKPRAWVLRTFPGWMTYPLGCALCWTWWATWAFGLLGWVQLNAVSLCVAPILNMVLDLAVRALIRANEPPVATITPTFYESLPPGIWKTHDAPFNPLDHEQTR